MSDIRMPKPGEIWEELDGRFRFSRRVKIIGVAAGFVQIWGVRKTVAKLSRFNGKSGGYRFVKEYE